MQIEELKIRLSNPPSSPFAKRGKYFFLPLAKGGVEGF
jgi:hypothetical protein